MLHLEILNALHKLLPQTNEAAGNCWADLVFSDCYFCKRMDEACLNNKYSNSTE